MMMEVKMLMLVGENFNLEKAVCNHGFFMMAPNLWMPSQNSFTRPLRLNKQKEDEFVTVSITHEPWNENFLVITVTPYHKKLLSISSEDKEEIRRQVARMLRISAKDDKMVEDFHQLVPEAKKLGFARIFRSPTLFEDIVKSLLLCRCPWKRSLDMAQALCNLQRKLYPCDGAGKRKRSEEESKSGNFPSPKEIARLDEKTLNTHCNLGFRASIILKVARNFENGSLNSADCEVESHPELFRQRLMKIKGFGPFTLANIMMCVGLYKEIPADSETIKHLQQVHGKTELNKPGTILAEAIEQVYGKYAPYQCLAYWMERVQYYEKKLGKLSQLPHSHYCNVTTMKLDTCDPGN